jgi:hypothetical protein
VAGTAPPHRDDGRRDVKFSIYYNKVDKGGQFAAWEQPELFTEEIRAAFKSLR